MSEGGRKNELVEQLHALLGSLGDAVIAADSAGRVTFLNTAAESLSGWERGDAVGQPLDRVLVIVNNAGREAKQIANSVLEGHGSAPLPDGSLLVGKDGTQCPIEGTAAAIEDTNSAATGAVFIVRDITERTERERLVRAALTHAEHITATVREPLIVLDETLRVQSANRSFYQVFQVSKEDTEDRLIYELGNGQWNIPKLRELLEKVLPDNETFDSFEVEHDFPHIGQKNMLVNARRLPPWGGQDSKILLAIEDVTERKRAEEEVRRNAERLKRALSINTIGVLFFEESTGTLIHANDTFLRQSGFTREEVKDRQLTWQKLTPSEYLDASLNELKSLQATGRIGPYEKEYYRKDGSRWWALFAGASLGDGTIIEYCIDITSMKEVERQLAESELRYRRLFETAKDGILIVDADTRKIIDANPFIGSLLGYSREELLGKELWEIGLLKDKEESQRAFEELQSRSYIRYDHLPLKKRTGEQADVEFVSNVYQADEKRIVQCNIRDLTERKLLQHVQQQTKELEKAGRRTEEFLAMLSHELRNPLAPLAAAAALLRMRPDEGSIQQEARAVIERQVAHLTHLIDDLLEVSRITSGRIRLRPETIPLRQVVENAVEMVRPLVAEHQHELTISLPPEPIWLYADAARLGQVVSNLLTNAIKYTDQGGHISVTVEQEADEAVLKVRDTGIGISSELLPHVFELFSQGEQPLARSQGGLGIGLAVVRTLVEMHGGTVEAHSASDGQGSEFTVRLPITPSPLQSAHGGASRAAETTPPQLRVLVVDDSIDAARMLARLVEALGHDARTVYTGSRVVAEALDYRPHVVLLDIGLPGEDGYEVARRIRQAPLLEGAVLAAITGYGQETDRERARDAGFDHHLIKPPDIEVLRRILVETAEAKLA